MYLTITYKRNPATDLGYLLHKNPNRPQTFDLTFGKAHVFYSDRSLECTTAVLLLDIDPINLARGRKGLFDYVNDRPFVASSFLSVAMAQVFGTAMSGKSKERPELASLELPFEIKIAMVPCEGNVNLINRLFEPLGYQISIENYPLNEKFLEWGMSHYYTISLTGQVKLQDLLNHIYVLIPVLDIEKHYFVDLDEIEKLIRHGGEWLKTHPEVELITSRYLNKRKNFVPKALDRLLEERENFGVDEPIQEKQMNLNDRRLEAVFQVIKEYHAKKIIDIGCGEGNLITYISKNGQFDKITGVDVSFTELEKARKRIDRYPEAIQHKINLIQGSLTYRDERFLGYDIATIIEVIEHLDLNRLHAFEKVIFEYTKPKVVIITTPNYEYNHIYTNLKELRHHDHRFEWTRSEFQSWSNSICSKYGYQVRFYDIGDLNDDYGSPTQMGVFST